MKICCDQGNDTLREFPSSGWNALSLRVMDNSEEFGDILARVILKAFHDRKIAR